MTLLEDLLAQALASLVFDDQTRALLEERQPLLHEQAVAALHAYAEEVMRRGEETEKSQLLLDRTWRAERPDKEKKAASGSKASFIRGYPKASAADVVKLGASKGLRFSESYVSNVRWQDKRALRVKSQSVPKVLGKQPSAPELRTSLPKMEIISTETEARTAAGRSLFTQALLEIGLIEARSLMNKIEGKAKLLGLDKGRVS